MKVGENSFAEGVNRATNERVLKNTVLFDSVNGTLYHDEEGNVVWKPFKGNEVVLVFDLTQDDPDTTAPVDPAGGGYTPIGGATFGDCFVVYTVNGNDDVIIWVFQLNEENRAYGQVLISDLSYPTDKFTQKRWNNVRMRGVFENSDLYRVKWVDGVETDSNPPRSLSFRQTGTVTDPTYNGQVIEGTFKTFAKLANITPQMTNLMAPFKMGWMHFLRTIDGQILSGRYIYLYRLILEDGYQTPWSHPTNPVFATTDILNSLNMHEYEMEASDEFTATGHRLGIWGVDTAYKTLEAAYVFIPDATNVPTLARSFAFVEISGQDYIEVDHTSMNGEVLSVDEMISLRLNIRAAQTPEVKDGHLWHGNYKTSQTVLTDAEVNAMFLNLKAVHIFRDLPIDRKGKTDATYFGHGNPEPCFNVPVDTQQTTLGFNDTQSVVLPIDNDYTGYRGKQVDNTYVGHPRDETVRYGLQVYDLEGNPAFVYHLCDYKFPKMFNGDNVADVTAERIRPDETIANVLDTVALALHKKAWLTTGQADTEAISDSANYPSILERPVVDADSALTNELPYGNVTDGYMKETFARILGIKFDGIDLSGLVGKIGGVAIVRCKIEHTTLAQGMISPTIKYGDFIKPTPRPNLPMRWGYSPGGLGIQASSGNSPSIRLWDREDTGPPPAGIYLHYEPEFITGYIPEVMFELENLPNLDSNQYMELVQICWEEFNCGAQILAMRDGNGMPEYGRTQGTLRCNSFLTDPRAGDYINSTKVSWHLMVNTRLQDHWGGSVTMPYRHDVQFPAFGGAALITGHANDADFAAEWADPRAMFPLYGDTFVPDFVKVLETNEELTPISAINPSWSFHNKVCYYHPQNDSSHYWDNFYGTFRDNELLTGADDSKRQGMGHERTLLMRFGGFLSGDADYFMCAVFPSWAETIAGSAYEVHPNISAVARWIFNWKRTLGALYGGQTEVALQSNIFISTGHFQPVGNAHFDAAIGAATPSVLNDVEVWGGECWLDLHSGAILYPGYAHDDSTTQAPHEVGDCGFIMVFPHESRYNLCLRNAPSSTSPMSPKVGLRPRTVFEGTANHSSSEWRNGLFHWSGINGDTPDPDKHLLEEFFINQVMRYSDLFRPYITEPRDFRNVNHWPQRWSYSERKVYSELVDAFRIFLVNNFRDLEGNHGSIMASVVHGDELYSFQETGFGVLRIYERSMLPSSNGAIVTGDAGAIEGIRYIAENIGCQHPESVVKTEKTVYWIDVLNKSIYHMVNGKAMSLSNEKGMNTMLRWLLRRYLDARSIYGAKGLSVVAGFDPETERVHFSFPARVKGVAEFPFQSPLSKRYRSFNLSWVNVVENALMHHRHNIQFIDAGSIVPEAATVGLNTIHVAEQDVIVLRTLPFLYAHSYHFFLYQGVYASGTVLPLSFTVKEFYILLPGDIFSTLAKRSIEWYADFVNRMEGDPMLSTPPSDYPASTSDDHERYRYHSPGYPLTIAQSEEHDGQSVMFHLYRTEPTGRFQVRRVFADNGLEDVSNGLIRSKLVYNEDAAAFEPWRSVGDIFALRFRSLLLTATETDMADEVYAESHRIQEQPRMYGSEFQSFLQFVMNQDSQLDKVFDNSRFGTGVNEIESIRYSTEEQAIVIVLNSDARDAYKRRTQRLPIRRVTQADRMRGKYLHIHVEFAQEKHRLAFMFSSLTLYRISNRN
jgi:hypothetical protein